MKLLHARSPNADPSIGDRACPYCGSRLTVRGSSPAIGTGVQYSCGSGVFRNILTRSYRCWVRGFIHLRRPRGLVTHSSRFST